MVGHTRNINSIKHVGKINTHTSQLSFDVIVLPKNYKTGIKIPVYLF